MTWTINGHTYDNIDAAVDAVAECICTDEYDDFLDENYGDRDGDLDICGHYVLAHVALYECDLYAYNEGFSDYIDSQLDDIRYELERLDAEDADYIHGTLVQANESEDEAPERYEVRVEFPDGHTMLEDFFDTREEAAAACDELNAAALKESETLSEYTTRNYCVEHVA